MVSQIIPRERLAAYERWEMGAFEKTAASAMASAACIKIEEPEQQTAVILPTVEQIERIHQEAHQDGYAAGYKTGHEAGYEAGRQQATMEAERLQHLLSGFQRALSDADQAIGNDLLALALDLAKQMVREALKVKPELVLAVVRETMHHESAFNQPPQLHLHPEDAALVHEHLKHELNDCTVRVDTHLERGDCRVRTGHGQVDATLATRWRRIAQALGQNSSWLE
ncbi:flagellar assembly protein FliH [Nitrosospira lacus]|uniref:Flagellar assembly protein FliH n=1 Tax=Nitrosospira lacus TaxID=1288494 RepID=A0A1W6SQH2_9PROT|nr:flagellar assembly protein FliH [Nitrosospira lacus]ARO88047.1 flagellar assembly protein FliH [Nitrosospira lacus]